MQQGTSGKVWLVGAGPGDPELLTLKAARAIAAADLILVDDLVNRAVLAHAKPAVRVIPVGKRGGLESTAQAAINDQMIEAARAGQVVVRLKGGDPFLFGRGGEEQRELRAAGIEVEVIPGITSGFAAPMVAGISLTHRDASPGVVFVTGHEKDPTGHRIDWAALARSHLTLVIYMGITNASRIEKQLIEAGLDPATPIAAIQSATLPAQKIARGTLDTLKRTLDESAIASPAILVIGKVAKLESR